MSNTVALTIEELRHHHPLPPPSQDDKYGHGQLLLVAGSRQTPGSAVIAAIAALRSGCGKVSIATSEEVAAHIALEALEARVIGYRSIPRRVGDRELPQVIAVAQPPDAA